MAESVPLLQINDLCVEYPDRAGPVHVLDDLRLRLEAGRTLGLVGESGCGKSMTALAILRLIALPGRITRGQIRVSGRDLVSLTEEEMRQARGDLLGMIFQEPMTSLNPVRPVGSQVLESLWVRYPDIGRAEARTRCIEALKRTGISSPEQRFDDYPHQLSGGMKQRVMIAMALVRHPALLLADEPTTALDVTTQAQVLELLRSLQASEGMGILLISHDLGLVAENADDVAIMYAGQIVEQGAVADVFRRRHHPYTQGLFNSLPGLSSGKGRLSAILGNVPSPGDFPSGCRFRTRCPVVRSDCDSRPPLEERERGHWVACHAVPRLSLTTHAQKETG